MRGIEGAGLAAAIAGVLMLTLAFAVGLAAPESRAVEPEVRALASLDG